MIYDTFENIGLYYHEGDALYKAIIYARDFDISRPDGEYEVEGRDIFARVLTYETSPAEERQFEAHQKYIDVQVILAGRERMDIVLGQELEPQGGYDEAEDVIILKAPETFSSIAMAPGMFVVFFPHDIHRPGCDLNGTSENRKICMKVHV
ncbi:YhcH/YjgK/YiaL family protein [bacterium]|nr:YhcH/YjgK/YiaL family protein [bacterium]